MDGKITARSQSVCFACGSSCEILDRKSPIRFTARLKVFVNKMSGEIVFSEFFRSGFKNFYNSFFFQILCPFSHSIKCMLMTSRS